MELGLCAHKDIVLQTLTVLKWGLSLNVLGPISSGTKDSIKDNCPNLVISVITFFLPFTSFCHLLSL